MAKSNNAVEVCKLFYKSPELNPAAAVLLLREQGIMTNEVYCADWKRYLATATTALTEIGAFQSAAPVVPTKKKKGRAPTRVDRWSSAASEAVDAIERLKEVQDEYQEWRDNLPENLAQTPVGEKLDAVCELDLEGALDTLNEATDAELPLGFGRD